ncbi:MAG: hypothetical protein H7125_10555 [Proteobacteria bacterium]|nr:hypothetical protein [Burkholderiales bacterium]
MNAELIGWASATILFATIVRQVQIQWRAGKSAGVSQWLFIGQLAASMGFAWYSYLLANPVFVVTNLLLVMAAMIGQIVSWRQHRE